MTHGSTVYGDTKPNLLGLSTKSTEMITKFPLKGLSIGNRCTIDTLDGSGWFHAPTNFPKEKFEALFKFCKSDWVNEKIAVVQHEGLRESGIPINPIVIGVEIRQ